MANTIIYDGRVDRAAMLRFYEERTVSKVNLIINGHILRVDDLIKKSKLSGAGYKQFMSDLDREISDMLYKVKESSSKSLLDLFKDQVSFGVGNLDKGIGQIWRVQHPRTISEDFILKQPLYKNTTLDAGWNGIGKTEKARIITMIRKGIASGHSENAIADTIFKEGFNVTRNQAKGLVVTATTSVYAHADHEVYKANAKALRGWQFIAVLDSRTTPTCAGLDGKVFDIKDRTYMPPRHWYCYDAITEVLTKDGFKLFKDVVVGDQCLSLDPETEDLSWQPVVTTFARMADEIVTVKSGVVDMAVTLDHPFIGQKRVDKGSYKEWLPKKYDSIVDIPKSADFRMFASSKWIGSTPATITVNDYTVDTTTFCKFMAWWLSDGYTSEKSYDYIDCAIVQVTHFDLMRQALSTMSPTTRTDRLGFTNQNLAKWLTKFGKCTDKYIPVEIKELSAEYITVFLEAYLLGDGSTSKQNDFEGYTSKDVRRFFTTSKQLMADLCELVIKAGGTPSVRVLAPSDVTRSNGEHIVGNHPVFHISWNRGNYRKLRDCAIEVDATPQMVYDVELAAKHTLLVKRNGKIIWGSNCRSTTIPIVKSYDQLGKLEGVAQIRKRNFAALTPEQIAKYDGQTPLKESYSEWLSRQPNEVVLRHLGDTKKLELFRSGQLTVDKFTNPDGNSVGIRELRAITDSGFGTAGDTRRFALAKEKLDTIKLGAARPEEIYESGEIKAALKEYYLLQAGELDGTLSLTNYRGTLLHNKKATKNRVLASPPREEQMRFNPITGVYNDTRLYQPSPDTLANSYRLVAESADLTDIDKKFITDFVDDLQDTMGVNERAVITENLRIAIGRYRKDPQPWANLKAVLQGQVKFDVMNISDYMETQLRKDANVLHKLKQANYIDPVLGPTQLTELHDTLVPNIIAKNQWEDSTAPKIAKELRNILDYKIPVSLKRRLSENDLENFYLKFARQLSLADSPDRDQVAVTLGRTLYNMANYRGSRNEWYELGVKLLDDADSKGFYKLETFGVQKRRMKSRMGGKYFGPYYDTFAVNIRIVDPRIQRYAKLTRKVEMGMRVPILNEKNRLYIREGYKTYFVDDGIMGFYDTRIPITSTSSFRNFPVDIVDREMTEALNWTAQAKYKIDPEFHDIVEKLLYFQDDRGKAQYYHDLNKYREYMIERGDAYERLKTMKWLRDQDAAFSNTPFLDHRARIYERGLIGPQSGETFRPFLNTAKAENFSELGFLNLQDQLGAFLGGASDKLEHKFNSLSVQGRQSIATYWRNDLIRLGNSLRRGKPQDIRDILEHPIVQQVDAEEQGKLFRLALELARIDSHLGGRYDKAALATLKDYKIALALEQDASSSGAQIIALTTKNKQLAELSNVVPTTQKRRLYDEIAESTFNDPRFRELNVKFGLTIKDLRKAAKAQNMVTLYGAGKRTGILSVEGKLSKVLGKEGTLVVKASDRDTVLAEISARMARYQDIDLELYKELKALRTDVKDIFNKGQVPGDDIMEQLYFLDSKTRDILEKMTRQYDKVVTPDDFQQIAMIMSEHLGRQVPILTDFTKYYGRLAQDFLLTSKPKQSELDYISLMQTQILGAKSNGTKLPKWLSRTLAIKDESVKQQILRRIPGYVPGSTLSKIVEGVEAPKRRRTGFKVGDFSLFSEDITKGIEVGLPNKLDKRWTNVPSVNFDGKVLEQHYTQVFEEKLMYKDKDGKWITNILQVPQKTEGTWWEEFRNKEGKINDIVDVTRARTAYGVSANHSEYCCE